MLGAQVPRTVVRALIALALAAGTRAAADDGEAPPLPPVYALTLGQILVYEGEETWTLPDSRAGRGDAGAGAAHRLECRVIGREDDGRFRVAVTRYSEMHRGDGDDRRVHHRSQSTAMVRLGPDGRGTIDRPDVRGSPALTFPQLPDTAEQADAGWQYDQRNVDLVTHRCRLINGAELRVWTIRDEQASRLNDLYGMTAVATYHFDRRRGLVVEATIQQGQSIDAIRRSHWRLTEVGRIDADQLPALAADVNRYLQLQAACERIKAKAVALGDREELDAVLDRTMARLDTGREVFQTTFLHEQIAHDIAELDSSRRHLRVAARSYAQIVGKPCPGWALPDLDGVEHRSADYRGRVVVLDFWYRGCGWCMRSMPQVRQIVEHYRGRPVVVIGMNVDRDDADARYVAEKLRLDHVTLRAGPDLVDAFAVRSFPTVVLVDPAGVVRDVHVGYSPTLRESLIGKIDGLHAEGGPHARP